MSSKIKSKFFSLAKFAGFIAACAAASFVAIAPLWLFATKQPKLYSLVVLLAAAVLVLYKVVVAAKKSGLKKTVFLALKIFSLAAGIVFAALAVANFSRLFFCLSLLGGILLFYIVRFVERKFSKAQN